MRGLLVRVILWGLVIFVIYYWATDPKGTAELVHSVFISVKQHAAQKH